MKIANLARTLRRLLSIILFMVLTLAALFYLFVLPALVANQTFEPGKLTVGFAAFLYLQLWMLIFEYAFSAPRELYGFKRKSLFFRSLFERRRSSSKVAVRSVGRIETLLFAFLSYGFTIYGFALAYVYASNVKPQSFNVGRLDILSAVYFSLTTIATVGYGDIVPVTKLARVLVALEILSGLTYAIFLFSLIATFAREKRPPDRA